MQSVIKKVFDLFKTYLIRLNNGVLEEKVGVIVDSESTIGPIKGVIEA